MKGKTSYKILLFMKRKPGLSMEEFQDYYENKHVPLALKYDAGAITRYVRRYIQPQPHAESGTNGEMAYDVVSELWFEDETAWKATLDYLSTSVMPDDVVQDEMNVFDRSTMRVATAIECETDLGAYRAG